MGSDSEPTRHEVHRAVFQLVRQISKPLQHNYNTKFDLNLMSNGAACPVTGGVHHTQ